MSVKSNTNMYRIHYFFVNIAWEVGSIWDIQWLQETFMTLQKDKGNPKLVKITLQDTSLLPEHKIVVELGKVKRIRQQ